MTRSALVVRMGLVLALGSGCTSLDGLSEGGAPSSRARPTPPPTTTQSAPSPACDARGPFVTAQAIDSGGSAMGARWNGNKSTVVFDRGVGLDLELRIGASFADATTGPFGPILPHDSDAGPTPVLLFPSISKDGLVLYYAAFFPPPSQTDIPSSAVYRAHRPSMGEPFDDYEPVLPASNMDFDPYLVVAANALYWRHVDPTNGNIRIMRYALDQTADPTVVFETSSTDVTNPVVSADEKALWYTDDRGGTRDIFVTTRPSPDVPFPAGTRVDTVSTATHNEEASWISDDQCELVYTRHDADEQTTTLWSAKR
ncbi:MAG TPA: hypothetical protein VIF62_06955 [Labilithrix sp.]|jgi:hypothetical protein